MNGEQLLERAARALREHTDAGWVALRDDVVATAVRAFRPSDPVRGRLRGGELWVASVVVVSRLRVALDQVPDARAVRIVCSTTADHELDRVTIELVALYGTPLVGLADRVRDLAAAAVAEVLGFTAPPVERVTVDVSVGDVTTDPRRL